MIALSGIAHGLYIVVLSHDLIQKVGNFCADHALTVPGATVRVAIGRQAAEFKYERGVQPRILPADDIAPGQRHRRGDIERPENLAGRPATARPQSHRFLLKTHP